MNEQESKPLTAASVRLRNLALANAVKARKTAARHAAKAATLTQIASEQAAEQGLPSVDADHPTPDDLDATPLTDLERRAIERAALKVLRALLRCPNPWLRYHSASALLARLSPRPSASRASAAPPVTPAPWVYEERAPTREVSAQASG